MIIEINADRPLIQVGPKAQIENLSADLHLRDPDLQVVPLRLEPGARLKRLAWTLDWQGRSLDVGKRAVMNQGGQLTQLRWIDTPPMYVEAVQDKRDVHVIEVAFSQALRPADLKEGVTVALKGAPVRIVEAVLAEGGEIVRYRVAAPLRVDEEVTWAYEAARGAIENLDGDRMRSVMPKKVAIR